MRYQLEVQSKIVGYELVIATVACSNPCLMVEGGLYSLEGWLVGNVFRVVPIY